jgi:hypothetical protein
MNQAAREEKENIPVAPFMKNLDDVVTRNKNQVNFINFVLLPWWKNMARLVPGFKQSLEILISNRDYYDLIANPNKTLSQPASPNKP